MKELEGKDITEVIAAGVSKLASVPAGGGAVAAGGGALQSFSLAPLCLAVKTALRSLSKCVV